MNLNGESTAELRYTCTSREKAMSQLPCLNNLYSSCFALLFLHSYNYDHVAHVHVLVSLYMHVPTAPWNTFHIHVQTSSNLKDISHFIVLAGFIRDTIPVDVLIHSTRVSSITVSSSTTVDEYLWGQVNLRERIFLHDPNPVTECRCGTHCPARATVCVKSSRLWEQKWERRMVNRSEGIRKRSIEG